MKRFLVRLAELAVSAFVALSYCFGVGEVLTMFHVPEDGRFEDIRLVLALIGGILVMGLFYDALDRFVKRDPKK